MKSLIFLFQIVFLVSIAACSSSDKKPENQAQEVLKATITEIGVEGMTCTGCENTVNKSIEKLEGIVEVSSSHIDKKTVVKYDESKVTVDQIKEAIAQVGYKVVEPEMQE